MLSEILLETLSFLDRSSLEACQLVNRSVLKMITKSNAALALRPMDKLSVNCFDAQRYILVDEFAKFQWHASRENEGDAMCVQIGKRWDQPQAAERKAMLSEILLEAMSFLDRSSLEACQLVSRSYLGLITKSNAALALRRMDVMIMRCVGTVDVEATEFVRYVRLDPEPEVKILRGGTDPNQLQVTAEEVVARTRNMWIKHIALSCVTCASALIALWRDTFDDRIPCRAVELSMGFYCSMSSDASLQQLFQPFASSILGVRRYSIRAWDQDPIAEFDALWSAWDRPTAQIATFNLYGVNVTTYFLDQLLREPEHGGRHYTVNANSLEVVEQYIQKFESGGSDLNFPTSLVLYRFQTQDGSLHKLRRMSLRTLDKPPNMDIPYPESLARRSRRVDFTGHLIEESRCDVYKVHNFDRRQTMHAYFWVATKRSSFQNVDATEAHFYHCHWFNVIPF